MKKAVLIMLSSLFTAFTTRAQETDSTQIKIDNIEQSLNYKTGIIELETGSAKLTVPKGFRYLDKEQSRYVLTDLWGNPADSSVLGMLVPENKGVLESNTWVFTISYDEMGYVKDDDAEDINYDDLLKEQQKDCKEANPQRIADGYQPIEFIGWASHPYYDKDKKILHWAKELKFGDDTLNTLNYNLRILGRKGIFMLNAIASVKELTEVKANIDKVIGSVEFKEGNKYSDFKPEIDKVAAWTIGGLVAGKILAKVGIFALIAKFGKLIVMTIIGGWAAIWKFLRGRKNKQAAAIENKEGEAEKEEEAN